MSLDKANSKLLVEIKKLHVPEDDPLGKPGPVMPGTIHELDLVNGGDDAQPESTDDGNTVDRKIVTNQEDEDGNGDGYNLC